MTEVRTPWFSGYENPARVGWYECKMHGIKAVIRMYWNGHRWRYNPDKPEPEFEIGNSFGRWPGDRWRGLAQPC